MRKNRNDNKMRAVQEIVYTHGTMNVSEIQTIMRDKTGKAMARRTVYKHLQSLREMNTEWINTQAKAGYLQTVRQLLFRKKERLAKLDRLFDSDLTPPRIKSDIAGRMTETEESIRDLMESLPLLMQFNALVNNNNHNESETSIIIRD